jgi:hypothetical protein
LLHTKYLVKNVLFSPVMLGLPVRRQRRYSISIRKDKLHFSIPWSLPAMRPLVSRVVATTGSIFFQSPKSHLKPILDEMARAQHYDDSSSVPMRLLLSFNDRSRLSEHIELAAQHRLDFVCVNVKQTSGFYRMDSSVPSLTTSSLIWGHDLRGGPDALNRISRPLTGYELLGVHGWPVLLPAVHPLSAHLPRALKFRHVLESPEALDDRVIAQKAGNGMHVHAIGLAIAVAAMGTISIGLVSGGSASDDDADVQRVIQEVALLSSAAAAGQSLKSCPKGTKARIPCAMKRPASDSDGKVQRKRPAAAKAEGSKPPVRRRPAATV